MANRPLQFSFEALEDRTVPAAASISNVPLPDPTAPHVSQGHSHHATVDIPAVGPNPSLVIGASNDEETLYVQKIYFDFLGRTIDSAAMPYVDDLASGSMSRREIADEILHSDEYYARRIESLYAAFLNRPADAVGKQGYLNDVHDGKSLEEVAIDLLSSDEYRNLHADDTAFVQDLFDDVLGRRVEREGLLKYVERVGAAAGDRDEIRGIVTEIVTSVESRKMGGEQAVELMLNQSASPTLGANFVEAAKSGATIEKILVDIAESDLYHCRQGRQVGIGR
jgi:hypothetical protein